MGLINVHLRRYDGKWTIISMYEDDTVDLLYCEGRLKTGLLVNQFELLFHTTLLPRSTEKTLRDFHIQNGSMVHMVQRISGGGPGLSTLTSSGIQRLLKPLPPHIELAYKVTDVYTGRCDESVPKAKMPCGHFITQKSMAEYCSNELKGGKSTFKCPDVSCSYVFPDFMVCHVACMDTDERYSFEQLKARNA